MTILKISKHIKSDKVLLQTRNSGFLFIELMTGIVVFMLFVWLIYSYSGLIIITKYNALKRYEALNALHSFIARATCNATLLRDKKYNQNGFMITWEPQNFKIPFDCGTQKLTSNVQNMIITTRWLDWNKKAHYIFMDTML